MRRIKLLIMLLTLSILVACEQDSSSDTSLESSPDQEQLVTDGISLPEPIQHVAMKAAYDYLVSTQSASYRVEAEFSGPQATIHKQQISQEAYGDGILKKYYLEIENTVEDESSQETFYYDGEKYFHRQNDLNWQETDFMTRPQMLMSTMGKILLETNQFDIELSPDNKNYLISLKQVSDENKAIFTSYLDIPLILSPSARIDGTYNYKVSRDNGQMIEVNYDLNLEDIGENYQISFVATAQEADSIIDIDVNDNEQFQDNIDFIQAFKANNPIRTLISYEILQNTHVDNQESLEVHFINLLNNQPYLVINSSLNENQEIEENRILYDGQVYLNQYNQVKIEDSIMEDYLGKYINYFIEEYDRGNFYVMEANEEYPVTIFRQVFENYEDFSSQVGFLDISSLERMNIANYAIEYFVEAQNARLVSINLWAISPEETEINNIIQLTFNSINKYNPNYVKDNISEEIWEAIENQ